MPGDTEEPLMIYNRKNKKFTILAILLSQLQNFKYIYWVS